MIKLGYRWLCVQGWGRWRMLVPLDSEHGALGPPGHELKGLPQVQKCTPGPFWPNRELLCREPGPCVVAVMGA